MEYSVDSTYLPPLRLLWWFLLTRFPDRRPDPDFSLVERRIAAWSDGSRQLSKPLPSFVATDETVKAVWPKKKATSTQTAVLRRLDVPVAEFAVSYAEVRPELAKVVDPFMPPLLVQLDRLLAERRYADTVDFFTWANLLLTKLEANRRRRRLARPIEKMVDYLVTRFAGLVDEIERRLQQHPDFTQQLIFIRRQLRRLIKSAEDADEVEALIEAIEMWAIPNRPPVVFDGPPIPEIGCRLHPDKFADFIGKLIDTTAGVEASLVAITRDQISATEGDELTHCLTRLGATDSTRFVGSLIGRQRLDDYVRTTTDWANLQLLRLLLGRELPDGHSDITPTPDWVVTLGQKYGPPIGPADTVFIRHRADPDSVLEGLTAEIRRADERRIEAYTRWIEFIGSHPTPTKEDAAKAIGLAFCDIFGRPDGLTADVSNRLEQELSPRREAPRIIDLNLFLRRRFFGADPVPHPSIALATDPLLVTARPKVIEVLVEVVEV